MGAGIAKDRAYARMFGTVAPRGLPAMSYFYFFSRDVVTMGASFNIPDPLAEEMAKYGVPKSTADVAAQLFCPVAMQFVTTPMHLLGLDCYNRPAQSFKERVELVAANYRKTVAARIARILPAFGCVHLSVCMCSYWYGSTHIYSLYYIYTTGSAASGTSASGTRRTRTSGGTTTKDSRSPSWCSAATSTWTRRGRSRSASRASAGPPCYPPWASHRWPCRG